MIDSTNYAAKTPLTQRTLAKAVSTSGVGLHSGHMVALSLHPLPVDSGIVFERSDLPHCPRVVAKAHLVKDTMMSSNLVDKEARVGTVEHLLSAVAGLGIDNLLIKVSAPEIPIMDGSAMPFVDLILSAGLIEQAALKKFIKILEPVRVTSGDKWAELVPFDGFELNFEIDFDHPAFDKQHQRTHLSFSTNNFISKLSQARTFGFLKDIEQLRQHNLALGGSMDNAIVLDEKGIINNEGLRYEDEFAKHKVLDAVGDLYLIGYPLIAQFNAFKSGHALNNALIKEVMARTTSFEVVTFDDIVNCPISYEHI
ncbi:MAG: UDP-3-O-acyl-N-acetylglucosamine deacetylase [Psychrobacter sp.]|nr:UDP-3-O-acyl-N-acetylglucosamine deacetylase [Psychrobacter sp.]